MAQEIEEVQDTSPITLVGREEHVNKIYMFILEHTRNKTGGSLCISGIPGTGKTASLKVAIKKAKRELGEAFRPGEVNAGYLRKPKQVFAEIMKSLTGKRYSVKAGGEAYRSLKPGTLVIVDEVDRLMTPSCDVLYSLFDATTQNVALIAIANTLNLLDEVIPKVASRAGLERLTFEAYRKEGLIKIIRGLIPETQLSDKGLLLVASRISASTGDIRRALELVRQAIDEVKKEGGTCAGPEHVSRAISNNRVSPLGVMVSNLSTVTSLMLKACVIHCNKSKDGTSTFGDVCDTHAGFCNDASPPLLFSLYFQSLSLNTLKEMGLVEIHGSTLNSLSLISLPPNVDVDIVREVLGLETDIEEEEEEGRGE